MFHVPTSFVLKTYQHGSPLITLGFVRPSLPSTLRTLTTYSYLSFAIHFFLWLLLHISFSHLPNPLSVTPYRQVITYGDNTFFRNDGTPKRRLNPQILGLHKHCSQKPKPYITDHFFLFVSFLFFIFYGSSNLFIVRNSDHEKLTPVGPENFQQTATKCKNFETPYPWGWVSNKAMSNKQLYSYLMWLWPCIVDNMWK
jgi:hypothetical protein